MDLMLEAKESMGNFGAWAYDVVGMAVLAALGIYLEVQSPFQKYLVPDTIWRYSYPYVENSIPSWALPVIGIFAPLVVIYVLQKTNAGRSSCEARRAAAGLCLAVALGFAVTNGIKNGVGNFRPDFVARCWPDGKVAWDTPGRPACTGSAKKIIEGRKSFPSGHTSMAFSGLGFLAIYLAQTLQVFDAPDPRRQSMVRVAATLAPLAFAMYVGLSRIQDYWHHSEDVIVGAIIGLGSAALAYCQKQPCGGGPAPDNPMTPRAGTYQPLARGHSSMHMNGVAMGTAGAGSMSMQEIAALDPAAMPAESHGSD